MHNGLKSLSNSTLEPAHITAVRHIAEARRSTPLCELRRDLNVDNPPQQFSRDEFWFRTVTCICTSVTRCGPGTPFDKFHQERPFSLRLEACEDKADLGSWAERTLSTRGIKFAKARGEWLEANLSRLKNGLWTVVEDHFYKLARSRFDTAELAQAKITAERNAARDIMGSAGGLKGVGPKQARNIWQCMGVTQFEIPLDSRVCNWASSLQPPLRIDAKKLYIVPYYEEVMGQIQALCERANELPCNLDAAVFSSVDLKTSAR
jgi:hypothetical protein